MENSQTKVGGGANCQKPEYADASAIQQITKADRNACHALRSKGKARATLRRLSSTVLLQRGNASLLNISES